MSGEFTPDRREALALGAGSLLASAIPLGAQAKSAAATNRGNERERPFDDGWLFRRGPAQGAEAPRFDDSGWRNVDLPHDWSIEDVPGGAGGPFDEHAIGGTATGFTVGGEGWYRKHFRLDGLTSDAFVEIEFDGVYCESEVWLNGTRLGQHLNGYAPFAFDLTPHLVRDGDNVLAVHVRNEGKNSRWYSGSGIYRQVRLHVAPSRNRVARWGVGGWTRRITNGAAEIEVTTRLEDADPAAVLATRLRDASGRVVAEALSPAAAEVKQLLVVRGARLWSPTDPYLHVLETEVQLGGRTIDRIVQTFGVRIVAMDTHRGMTVNGERIMVRGGCIHHDNGLLGACAFADADDRKVRLLKARGYNAIRSSHNPASRSLLDACDRHGMLVMNEAFDMWFKAKLPDDYARHFGQDWQNVVDAMVLSSRNHPSIVMWSIGNEIPERSTAEGVHWEWTLAERVRTLDPTRPVTAALNGLLGPLVEASAASARPGRAGKKDNAAAVFLDVAGYNYRLEEFERDHASFPWRIMVGTETFAREAWDYVKLNERAPYALGEFLWTAMDYLGEAGIGASAFVNPGGVPFALGSWPWVVSWCGDLDLIGDQKMPSRFRDVAWGLSPLEIGVQAPGPAGKVEYVSNWGWHDELPSWTWLGQEGKAMTVRLYTRGDRVDLLLNGAKVGEAVLKPEDRLRAEIKVPYAPGVLEAVAWSGGKVVGRRRLETVGAPARLRLRAETRTMGLTRQNLGYVAIDVLDAAGRRVPQAALPIALSVEGPARLAGFGSANPQAGGSYQSGRSQSYRGRALAVLRGQGTRGTVRVVARSDGLASASTALQLA